MMADVNEIISELNKTTSTEKKEIERVLNEIKRHGKGIDGIQIDGQLAKTIIGFGIDPKKEKSIDDLKIKLNGLGKGQEKKIIDDKEKKDKEGEKKGETKSKNSEGETIKKGEKEKGEEIKRKIEEEKEKISKKITEDLKGDEKLKEVVKEEFEKIIKNEEIKTSREIRDELAEKMAKTLGKEKDVEIEMESKKVVEEAEKWEIKNIDTVRDYRKKNFEDRFKKEVEKLNPEINNEQLGLVEEQGKMIADVYFGKGIENIRNNILESGEGFSPGRLENAYSDVEGMIGLLRQSPEKLKTIKKRYGEIKNDLAGLKQLPFNIREFRSFDGLMGVLERTDLLKKFNFGQNKVLTWADRINTFTGGWLGRTFVNWGGKFVAKIGNESIRVFAENGLKIFAEKGFQQGFNTVLQGFLSGAAKKGAVVGIKAGLQVGAKVAGGVMAKAGAAAATGPWGWVAAAAIVVLEVLKKLKNVFSNIAKKLNISFDTKEWLQEQFGKPVGWVLDKAVKPVVIGLVIAIALFFPFTQAQMLSTSVSLEEEDPGENLGSDDYSEVIAGDIPIPKCDPNTHDRRILREIAKKIEGKVEYNRDSTWFVIGSHPRWGVNNCKDTRGTEPCGLDCAKFVSWVWLQCMGKERGRRELGSTYGLMATADKGTAGWEYIHPKSEEDLKIGDIFIRDNATNHAVLYIGDGETMESRSNNNNPSVDKIYKFTDDGIFLKKDKNRMKSTKIYDHIIRINNVFKNDDNGNGDGGSPLPNKFKVATFNIGHANKTSGANSGSIGLKIKESGFDVVGLQEANSTSSLTGSIAGISGMVNYYHTSTSAGNSILSKSSLNGKQYFDITENGDNDSMRALQKTILNINGRVVSFYNVHLDFNQSVRDREARNVVNIIKSDPNPLILVGDFNFGASGCSTAYGIFNDYSVVAYDEANSGTKCTDMIITSKNRGIKVVSTNTYRTRGVLSDHNLVSATLELN